MRTAIQATDTPLRRFATPADKDSLDPCDWELLYGFIAVAALYDPARDLHAYGEMARVL